MNELENKKKVKIKKMIQVVQKKGQEHSNIIALLHGKNTNYE